MALQQDKKSSDYAITLYNPFRFWILNIFISFILFIGLSYFNYKATRIQAQKSLDLQTEILIKSNIELLEDRQFRKFSETIGSKFNETNIIISGKNINFSLQQIDNPNQCSHQKTTCSWGTADLIICHNFQFPWLYFSFVFLAFIALCCFQIFNILFYDRKVRSAFSGFFQRNNINMPKDATSWQIFREIGDLFEKIDEAKRQEIKHERYKAITQSIQLIAHDVRKPFSLCKAIISLLCRINLPEKEKRILKMCKEEIDRSLPRIEEMLEEVMSTGIERPRSSTSVNEIIRFAIRDCFYFYPECEINTEIITNGDFQILIEPQKLHRIFSNLVSNAIAAMKQKGTIQVCVDTYTEKPNFCIFSVKNGNSYISPDDLPRIFDSDFTKTTGGHGLGLFFVKQVITESIGEIRVESCEINGTTFFFILPAGIKNTGNATIEKITSVDLIKLTTV